MALNKVCTNCKGTGKYMGPGMMQVDCKECLKPTITKSVNETLCEMSLAELESLKIDIDIAIKSKCSLSGCVDLYIDIDELASSPKKKGRPKKL